MSFVPRAPSVLVVALALAACGPDAGPEPAAPPVVPVTDAAEPCPVPDSTATYSNLPYVETDCWTTDYGPASADVVLSDTTMLYCDAGRYALCFFSGPAHRTGTDSTNARLPCTLSEDGTSADCACQAYTASADAPMFVALTSILNEGVYLETVQACGPGGGDCKTLATCGEDPASPACQALPTAPVCQYVAGQSPTDPTTSLIPDADLISTFSFAMRDGYAYAPQTSCTADSTAGLYAGCMTAPCTSSSDGPLADGDPVQCACPTFEGPFQVGQPGQSCDLRDRHVWSASYTPPADAGT